MLVDIAKAQDLSLSDCVRHILMAPRGDRTLCIHFIIDEADIETNLAHADMMVGSDGNSRPARTTPSKAIWHVLLECWGVYVRERGILSLPEAVRRMTALSAQTFGLLERGRLCPGYWADLVLFDPDVIIDTATYDEPQQSPLGVRAVVVNGIVAYQKWSGIRVQGRWSDVALSA